MIKLIESKKLYKIDIQAVSIENLPGCMQNSVDTIKVANPILEPISIDFNLLALFGEDKITQFELCGENYNTEKIYPDNLSSPGISRIHKTIPWSNKSRWHFKNITITDVACKSQIIYVRARLSSGESFNLAKIILTYLGCLEEDILEKKLLNKENTFQICIPEKKVFFEIKTLSLTEKLSQIMRGPMLENIIESTYSQIIKDGDICIDGGAHVGAHTFPMSRLCGSKGTIHAFEVIPHIVNSLERKIESNNKLNNIILHPKALSEQSGKVLEFFHIVDRPGLSGLKKNKHKIENDDKVNKIEVQTTTIDEVLGLQQVKFIKLDLEGGEFFALKGAANSLKNSDVMVIFENGRQRSANLYGYTANDFFDFFEKINYRLFDLFGRELTKAIWFPEHDKVSIPWYSIAVPKYSYLERFIINQLPKILVKYLGLKNN